MLGHASAAMTLDVYADLLDSDLDAVADRWTIAPAGGGAVIPTRSGSARRRTRSAMPPVGALAGFTVGPETPVI